MAESVSKLSRQPVPGIAAQGELHGVVLGIGHSGELRDPRKLRELGGERPHSCTGKGLVDVECNGQFPGLIPDIADLEENAPGELLLDVEAVILNVGRPQILADAPDGKWRSRRPEDRLVEDYHPALLRYTEYRSLSDRVSGRASSGVGRPAIVNEEVSVDDVIVDPIVCPNDGLSPSLRSEGETNAGSEIIQFVRIEPVNILADDGQTSRKTGNERGNRVPGVVQGSIVVVAQA